MSPITNVILIASAMEEVDDTEYVPPMTDVNTYLANGGFGRLARMEHLAGGNKVFTVCVWMGAFNYLPVEEFIETVRAQQWRDPDNVMIMINEETRFEDEFQIYRIKGGPFLACRLTI